MARNSTSGAVSALSPPLTRRYVINPIITRILDRSEAMILRQCQY
jgi:hypothetical protein